MLRNLRWLAPMGLICAAGTAHAAEVVMVVQNESEQPWRLRCLQATPQLKVRRIRLDPFRRLPAENRSYQDQQEITVEGKQRVEFRLTDDVDAASPFRFALLHGGMTEPDGTILTFSWNWKAAEHTESLALEHAYEPDQARHDQRRLAVKVEANVCRILWGSFTDPLGKAVAAESAAGGRGAIADTEFMEPGGCFGDFPLGLEFAPALDLELVCGNAAESASAIAGWLNQHAATWETFNELSREYVKRVVQAAAEAGIRDVKEAIKAGIREQAAIQEINGKYLDEGKRILSEVVEASVADWLTHGKLPPGDWTIPRLSLHLNSVSSAWLHGRIREEAQISLDLRADAALEIGAAGSGAAGSGAAGPGAAGAVPAGAGAGAGASSQGAGAPKA
jgi:hypothetical protein